MSRRILLSAIVAVALVAGIMAGIMLSGIGAAQPVGSGNVPQLMHYQAILLDESDNPVDGWTGYSIRIYDVESGGDALWFREGIYNISAGMVDMLLNVDASLFEGDERWLETRWGGQVQTPRQRLASVPYAFQAENAQKLQGEPASSFLKLLGNFTTPTISDLHVLNQITMSPKVRYYSIPACAFQPFSSDYKFWRVGQAVNNMFSPADDYFWYAPVNLPHGATVTEFQAHVIDAWPDTDISCNLIRVGQDDSAGVEVEMSTVSSSGSSSDMQEITDSTISSATIDSENYIYFVEVVLRNGHISHILSSVRITYEVTEPLP